MAHTTYLIIGGGMTGAAAAKGIRELDSTGAITLVSAPSQVKVRVETCIVAIKPQILKGEAPALAAIAGRALMISIAAGTSIAALRSAWGAKARIIRAMPNTPGSIGRGITGLYAAKGVGAKDKNKADALLKALGETVWVKSEALIDSVTALSGSGPAYVFYFVEAMMQAAAEMGLPPEQGKALALATFAGATALADSSDEPPEVLRERVTSKGGTTHAALTTLDSRGVKAAFVAAIRAAESRARELGDEFGRA